MYYPNHWTLPGGKVEIGESPEQALIREVKEELDIKLVSYACFKIVTEKTSDQTVERHIYWGKISREIEDLRMGEGVALKYFPAKEMSSLKIAFDLKPIIEEFMKSLTDRKLEMEGYT